jgi:hypothetical protein
VHKVGEAPPAAGVAPAQLTVKLEGPVQYVQTKPTRAVTTSYTGHMAQLAAIRDSMKAWGVTHGEDVGDRPYETYSKGIATSFTDGGEFTLFWPIKEPGSK